MLNSGLNREPLTILARVVTAMALVAMTLPVAAASRSSAAAQPAHRADTHASAAQAAMIATAQVAPASLAVVFYDQHSGLLPDVDVSLTQDATGATRTVRSDQSGSFSFRDLPPGDYTLVTSLAGFAPVRNLIRLGPGASVKRNIVLPLGTLRESITISSDGTAASRPGRSSARLDREIPEPRVPSPCVGRIGGCIKPPTKTLDVKPVYPAGLAEARVGGEVVLVGRVGIDGYVSDLRVADMSNPGSPGAPHPDLVASAMEAVRQWEFNPTLLNGAPVEASITITARFTVR